MRKNTEAKAADEAPRPTAKWKWAIGAVVCAVVVWQVLHGVFVQSVDMPGIAKVDFMQPHDPSEGSEGNSIRQMGGSENKANIAGGRDNTIQQDGQGNTATIGGQTQ